MSKVIKNPNDPATPAQTFTLFRLTKRDYRNDGLTKQQASDLISSLLSEKKPTNEWKALYDAADKAGREAVAHINVMPMIVSERENPLNDNSPIKKSYIVEDGVCGFAWISVRPGTCSFARWLKKNNLGRTDSYYGGVTIWVSDYNQSMQKKYAYAAAFANVLQKANIDAFPHERMD